MKREISLVKSALKLTDVVVKCSMFTASGA